MTILQEELKNRFDYIDGTLVRKYSFATNAPKGLPIGVSRPDGYLCSGINGRLYLVHRLIWAWHYGTWPKYLDHKDRNRANNRIENLRSVSMQQNAANTEVRKISKTGTKGVYSYKHTKRYRAKININGCQIHIGYFKTAVEAESAFCAIHQEWYGVEYGKT